MRLQTDLQDCHRLGRARQNAHRPRPLLGLHDIPWRLGLHQNLYRLVDQPLKLCKHTIQPVLHRLASAVPISRHTQTIADQRPQAGRLPRNHTNPLFFP